MSAEARLALVNHPNLLLRSASQRADLLNEGPDGTTTTLIAFLTDLCIEKGHFFEATAIRSDHSDDSELGAHAHRSSPGDAIDGWFNSEPKLGAYLDQGDPRFLAGLRDAALDQYEYQCGLGGAALTQADIAAAGPHEFADNGSDHVHFGAVLS